MKIAGAIIYLSAFLTVSLFAGCQKKLRHNGSASPTEQEAFDLFLDSLRKSKASEFEEIDAIRKYLARRIDLGKSLDSLADNYFKAAVEDISPFRCMELFEQNKLTARCAFTSHILARLYKYAGHHAYIYTCGFDKPLGKHQFVLVAIDGKLIVEDAFHNITITDSANRPKDFLEIISEVKAGNFDDIRVVPETVSTELWLESKAQMDSLSSTTAYRELFTKHVKEVVPEGNRLKIVIERSYAAFTGPSLEAIKPFLKQQGLSENYLSIYLKPELIKDSDGVANDSLKKMIEAL